MPPLNNFTRTCIALAVSQSIVQADLRAATVTVNSNLDEDTTSVCTLRSAIEAINFQASGGIQGCSVSTVSNPLGTNDEILFDLPIGQETITLNGNSLSIFLPMSINPNGQEGIIIDANEQSRVITLGAGTSSTTINQLTLTGGSTSMNGGGVYMNNATGVTISNSTITGNVADGVGGGVFVRDAISFTLSNSSLTLNTGGVYLRYTNDAQISNCVISDNTSDKNGVGISLYRSNTTAISDSLISNNSTNGAGDTGGGLYVAYGVSNSLTNSLVSENYAGDGGGLYFQSTNNFLINASTISKNSVANKGGGLHLYNSNTAVIVNSTISGNSAPSDYGGGIYLDNNSAFGAIVQSTIVDNSAQEGGGIYALRSVDVSNTVIANNTDSDCNGDIVGTDLGNWVEDGSCNGEPASGDPRLNTLGDNGGPTPTHSPRAGSGLINAGDLAVCTSAPVNSIDQRAEPRGEESCTIGAVEFIDESAFFVIPTDNDKTVIIEL